MKTIKRTMYVNISDLLNEYNSVKLHVDNPHELNTIKANIEFEVETFKIKIIKRHDACCHIVNDSPEGRLNFSDFMAVVNHLKKGGTKGLSYDINWDIYPGQPVYEYFSPSDIIAHKIRKFNPLIEVIEE
jgi:hypothetical protein